MPGRRQQAGETPLPTPSNLVRSSNSKIQLELFFYGESVLSGFAKLHFGYWRATHKGLEMDIGSRSVFLSHRFKVYARWLGGQRGLCGCLAPLELGGRGGRRRHVEQHRLPGKRLVLGTGKQRGLGTEPRWEEAQQQGGLLSGGGDGMYFLTLSLK